MRTYIVYGCIYLQVHVEIEAETSKEALTKAEDIWQGVEFGNPRPSELHVRAIDQQSHVVPDDGPMAISWVDAEEVDSPVYGVYCG